jgi:lipid kinase YegS
MLPIRLILNGRAADDLRVEAALKSVRDTGRTVEVVTTQKAGDAPALTCTAVEDARRGKIGTIVAGGGDGTVNEVFGAAMEAKPPAACSFAVLPLGTGNDFARSIGVPTDDLTRALQIAAGDNAHAVDIGVFDGKPFFNMATDGFGARVTAETDPDLKKRLGGLAYLLTGVSRFGDLSSSSGRFRAEGFEWEGAFIAVAVGNGRQAGGGVVLCPDAVLDDGLLDLTILPEMSGVARASALLDWMNPVSGTAIADSMAKTARSAWIEFASHEPLFVNLDGETVETTKFRAEVMPDKLRLHVGPDALGLAARQAG